MQVPKRVEVSCFYPIQRCLLHVPIDFGLECLDPVFPVLTLVAFLTMIISGTLLAFASQTKSKCGLVGNAFMTAYSGLNSGDGEVFTRVLTDHTWLTLRLGSAHSLEWHLTVGAFLTLHGSLGRFASGVKIEAIAIKKELDGRYVRVTR